MIYVVNAGENNPKRLWNSSADETDQSWSRDAIKIVLVSSRDSYPEIYVMNSDGSRPVRLNCQ